MITKKMYVAINDINKITEFVQKASQVDGDVICTKGRYTIDGKSIMGVFSINTSEGIMVEYPETAIDFEEYLSQFKVNKAGL